MNARWVQATPLGPVAVRLGDGGVERIWMPERALALGDLPGDDDRRPTRGRPRTGVAGEVARELAEFFGAGRATFDVPVDLGPAGLSRFQEHVLRTVMSEVPWGETVTYGEVAEIAGRPGAARAVGTAMSRNPVPFVIPCHRVVAASGIGGYGGGAEGIALKRALLAREGHGPPSG